MDEITLDLPVSLEDERLPVPHRSRAVPYDAGAGLLRVAKRELA
jgi:hypothetical protein